ncbi:MAG: potassium channel family protein [Acidimicrobiales bacterium]
MTRGSRSSTPAYKDQQRLAMLRCGTTIALSWVLILGAYFALPIGHESGLRALAERCSVEALGIVIALFLVLFSGIYLAMSHQAARTFTQPLDHIRALDFTITVFSTVGFGDITPRSDASRLIVSAQMLLDLAIIGIAVRLLFNAANRWVATAEDSQASLGS